MYDIAVYDVSGRKVISAAASSIDLTTLSAGAYIINVTSDRNSFSIKVRL